MWLAAVQQHVVEAHGAGFRCSVSAPGTCAGALARGIVAEALRLGYRHVDTAEMYDNEREVGEGLRASGSGARGRIRHHQDMAVAFRRA